MPEDEVFQNSHPAYFQIEKKTALVIALFLIFSLLILAIKFHVDRQPRIIQEQGSLVEKNQEQVKEQNSFVEPNQGQVEEPISDRETDELTSSAAINSDATFAVSSTWITYSNNNLPYIFKYPDNLSLEEGNMLKLVFFGPTQIKNSEMYDGIFFMISLPFELENLSLEAYVDNHIAESTENADIIKDKEEVIINGLHGYSYSSLGLGISRYTFLQSENKTWTVEIVDATEDPGNLGYNQVVDQILSSFEFIE